VLRDCCRDTEEDCRNNAVYGLGELLLWGGQELGQHRDTILVSLSQMLKIESAPRVVDNIIGAIARAVIADVSGSAVEDIVTAVTANLPLKEDTDEYDTVFKMFAALLALGIAAMTSNDACVSSCVDALDGSWCWTKSTQ